jgi:SAM-dependent methyltransferase
MIEKIIRVLRTRGLVGLFSAISSRLKGSLSSSKFIQANEECFLGKKGIEIGGPSRIFSKGGAFPVYSIVGQLDNCNFGNITVWEGSIEQGQTFQFDKRKPPGRQYVLEATDMKIIDSGTYGFLLSSHALEHSANPILALSEWVRLLKNDGVIVLVLPHKDATFDHRRPVTTLEHLIADFDAGMGEGDLTHMEEILDLHDLDRDPEAGGFDAFKERSKHNVENRCFHQHVFDTCLAVELVDYMGLQIKAVETIYPMHILVVAQKVQEECCDNSFFTSETALYRRTSVFFSDRIVTNNNE